MGNLQSDHQDSRFKLDKPYTLTKGKEGYVVLLGNELSLATSDDEETVGRKLSHMEDTFSSLGFHVMAPFQNVHKATFTKEEFKRICLMHFDRDMLQHLSGYSSFFVHYCGLGNEHGIVTKDGSCIQYVEIIKSVVTHTNGKPTVFIFDCVVSSSSFAVEGTIRYLKDKLQDLPPNVFIFFNFQNYCFNQPGLFTKDLSITIEEFSNFLSFPDITIISAQRSNLIGEVSGQSYITFNTMTAELIFNKDPLLTVDSDIQTCATYCCVSIKHQGPLPLPLPDAVPGCGRKIFILFASDAIGLQLESSLVWKLAKWLLILGFDVYCDKPKCDDNKAWLRWYTAHIVSCKNVIIFCSPEIGRGFQSSTPTSRWSVCGSLISALYQKLDKDGRDRFRFFPVLLAPHKIECIPSIIVGSKFYCLTGPPPDGFNPKQLRGNYDELVFHISRLPPPPTAQVGPVQPLPDTKNLSPILITSEMISSLLKPQDGYIPVPHPTPIIEPPLIATQQVDVRPPQPNTTFFQPLESQLLFPTKQVSLTALLWLSQRIVEWKFLGRRLGLEEYQLSRIEKDNPQSTGEKAIQMLFAWKDQTDPKKFTYNNLLNGLRYVDGKKLCQDFVHFVNEHGAENES